MKSKVIVAHPQRLICEAFSKILTAYCDVEILDSAQSSYDVIALGKQKKPDAIILYMQLLEMYGVEVAQKIRQINPNIKIILIGSHQFIEAITINSMPSIHCYMHENSSLDELVSSLRFNNSGSNNQSHPAEMLTPKERKVLQLVAEGLTTKQIASNLYISEKTVGSHRENISRKLNISNIASLTKYAIREGLTSLQ